VFKCIAAAGIIALCWCVSKPFVITHDVQRMHFKTMIVRKLKRPIEVVTFSFHDESQLQLLWLSYLALSVSVFLQVKF